MDAEVREMVISVIARRSGLTSSEISDESRLVQDLHLDGDDAVDSLIEIAKKSALNLKGFDANAYFSPEPSLLSFFKAGNGHKRELTVAQITEAASTGTPLGHCHSLRGAD